MAGTFRAFAPDPKLPHVEALREAMLTIIDAARSDDETNLPLRALFVVVGEPAKPQRCSRAKPLGAIVTLMLLGRPERLTACAKSPSRRQ